MYPQPTNHLDAPPAGDDAARRERARQALWFTLGTLFQWRWFIAGATAAVAVLSVVLSLMMANWYQASARVLMPEAGGGLNAAMLRNLPAAASALLGGGGGDYMRYLSILTSRSVMDAAIDTFDLITVYEKHDSKMPRTATRKVLDENTDFAIDMEYEHLSISVYDKDPQRAADMANFFVRKLNEVNARLSSQSAANYRRFIENRYVQARADMDSVLDATRRFQQEHGVFDLTTQAESFFEHVAVLRTQALEAEIQHEVALSEYGAANPTVRTYGELAKAANRKYREALAGSEQLLPVAQSNMPAVVRAYAGLEMERAIQTAILEILGPLYEQARLQEEREVEAVQVVDHAVRPEYKAKPRRSIIVILATLSGFCLAVAFVLVYTWFRRYHAVLLRRLQDATAPPDEVEARA